MNRTLTAVALALALSACVNDNLANTKFQSSSAQLGQISAATDDGTLKPQPVRRSSRVLLGSNYTSGDHGDPLPERVEGPQGFVLANIPRSGQLTLQELALRITKHTGLTVLISNVTDKPKGAAPAPISTASLSSDPGVQSINDLISTDPEQPETITSNDVKAYTGPLSTFLDEQMPRYGTDWDVYGQVIYLSRELSRTYPVVDMASTTTLSAGLNGSGTSSPGVNGASGANSTNANSSGAAQPSATTGSTTGGQSSSTTTNIDGWKELLGTLVAYTGDPSRVYPEPSNGQVTVKCARFCQAQAKAFIQNHNRTAGRQVMVTLAVLKIQKTGSDDYGFDPKVLYQNLPTGYTLSLLGQTNAVNTLAGSVTGAILNPPPGSTAAKFNGTSIAVQAISQDEEITGRVSKYGIVANNRPLSIRNALDFSFVQNLVTSVSTSLSNSAAQVTTIVVGDQLQIVPRLQPDGNIRLQFALSQTAIQSQQTVTIGNTETTIPQITDNSSSPFEFTIRNGATLVLSDVADDSSDRVRSGTGSLYNWLLGGQANASNDHDKTIIVVSAQEWHPGDAGPTLTAQAR